MSPEVPVPRSGVWHLRSKLDPRWNRTGQYSSVGDAPFWMPAEAQEALEQLHATLGQGPPDDLQQISIPYPSPKFKRLFDHHVFEITEKQALFQSVVRERLTDVNLNWRAGELSIGAPGKKPAHVLPAQYLGILDAEKAYWQWGWFSEGEGTLSPLALKSVRFLKEYGAQHEIPEMTYAEVPLGSGSDRPWFNVDYLAIVSAHLTGADFYVAMPVPETPGLTMYWLATGPQVLPKAPSESQRFFNVIKEAMPHWDRPSGARVAARSSGPTPTRRAAASPTLAMAAYGSTRPPESTSSWSSTSTTTSPASSTRPGLPPRRGSARGCGGCWGSDHRDRFHKTTGLEPKLGTCVY